MLLYWKRDWVKSRLQVVRSERAEFPRTEGGIVNRGYTSGEEEEEEDSQ